MKLTFKYVRKPLLIKLSTDKTVSDAAAALQAAVQANHFGVMQVHLLKETMQKRGVVFASECVIVEVCQLQLEGVVQEVEATILKIMEEAAAG